MRCRGEGGVIKGQVAGKPVIDRSPPQRNDDSRTVGGGRVRVVVWYRSFPFLGTEEGQSAIVAPRYKPGFCFLAAYHVNDNVIILSFFLSLLSSLFNGD